MRRERERLKREVNKEERDPTEKRQRFHLPSSGKRTDQETQDGSEKNNKDRLEVAYSAEEGNQ